MIRYTYGSPFDLSEKVLAEFVEAYSRDPFGSLLVLPTPALVREVGQRLTGMGMCVASTSLTTLDGLAEDIVQLNGPALIVVSPVESERLLRATLCENRTSLPMFFSEGRLKEGFLTDILVFIDTCDRFCLSPAQLRDGGTRREQLALVLEAFRTRLESGGMISPSGLLQRAAMLVRTKGMAWSKCFIFGFFEPDPDQHLLLAALGEASPETKCYVPYMEDPKVFSWERTLGFKADLLPTVEGRRNDLSGWFDLKGDMELTKIAIDTYPNQLDEMRQVAGTVRSLIDSGTDPARIAILLPMRRASLPLVREVLADFEVEANMDQGTALAESPLIQSMLGVLQVPVSDFQRGSVVGMLASPYLRWRVEGEENGLSSYTVDRLSREAGIVKGRTAWASKFNALVHRLQEEAALPDVPEWRRHHFERKVAEIERTEKALVPLLDLLFGLEAKRSVGDHVRALRGSLRALRFEEHLHCTDPSLSRREAAALRRFMSCLDHLETSTLVREEVLDLKGFLALLKGQASALRVNTEQDKKGAITVAGLRSAALLEFDHVFIPGLVEGNIPAVDLRHPFVRGSEARDLGLLSDRDILRHERYYFLMALSSANQMVHLSWPKSIDGELVVASSFLDSVRPPGSGPKARSMWSPHSRLGTHRGMGLALTGKATPEAAWAHRSTVPPSSLLERANVERCLRHGKYGSAHDGVLGEDPEVVSRMSRLHGEKAYSASMLEDYALCPFRYYLRHVLALEAIEEVGEDVQSRDLGSLFHESAFRFYRARAERGDTKLSPTELEGALAEMRSIAAEECEAYDFSGPAWQASRRRLIGEDGFPGWVGFFLRNEAADPLPGLTPKYFELWVGMKLNRRRSDPASVDRMADIPLGEGVPSRLRLRCKVDRVDVDGDGGFFVIDYKTGKGAPGPRDIAKGLALQIPLYILALQDITGRKGVGGAYYSIGAEDDTQVVPVMGDDSIRARTKRRLDGDLKGGLERSARYAQAYVAGMMAARFHPSVGAGPCPSHCEYRHVCRFSEMRVLDMGGDADADA